MKAKREAPPRRSGDRRRDAEMNPRTAARRRSVGAPPPRTRPRRGTASPSAREPRAPRSGPQTTPRTRPAARAVPAKNASQAKARAKARKAKKPKVVRVPLRERLITRLAAVDLRPRTLAAKVPFVVVVIGGLGLGLALTLWLSTDSAERSYQLGHARKTNQLLLQDKEALERQVLEAQAAPALAEAARNLGMIPTKDAAHLVQDPSGNWVVVGTPTPAEGVPPPPLNVKLPDEQPAPPPPNPVEVPVRVDAGEQHPRVAPGPQVLVRAPDGATTLGAEHLPDAGPALPGGPPAALAGPAPGPAPAPAPGTVDSLGPVAAGTPGIAP